MKQIGLFVKQEASAQRTADAFEKWLRQRDVDVIRQTAFFPQLGLQAERECCVNPETMICVFVLGGDGTFLSASRWIGEARIPMIGVKFGDIGFLAEIVEDDLFSAAEAVLSQAFTIEGRSRLRVRIFRKDRLCVEETVLNDVVINKGALARLANIETHIDDQYLTTYRSDGLIVATPTGSTAYCLAAGGPVVHPAVEGILVAPICPFTLSNRVLFVPSTSRIQIRLGEKTADIVATFDGQQGLEISPDDTILIEKSPFSLELIKLPGHNYFDILKAKLRWSGGRI